MWVDYGKFEVHLVTLTIYIVIHYFMGNFDVQLEVYLLKPKWAMYIEHFHHHIEWNTSVYIWFFSLCCCVLICKDSPKHNQDKGFDQMMEETVPVTEWWRVSCKGKHVHFYSLALDFSLVYVNHSLDFRLTWLVCNK